MKKSYLFLACCLPFLLYILTLAPTFLWSDSAKLALQVKHFDLYDFSHGYHPFHTVLGILFSFLPFEFAVTQNLLSAFFSAVSLVLFFLLLNELGYSDSCALIGSLILSISHTFWLYSVINETYSIHAFFLILLLWLSQKYRKTLQTVYLFLTFFFLGLSFYNHSISMLFIVPIFFLTFMKCPFVFRKIFLAGFAFVLGISPLFIIPTYKLGVDPLMDKIFQDTSAHFTHFFDLGKIFKEVWKFPFYLGYQFPSFALLSGIVGVRKLGQKAPIFNYGLIILFLLNTAWALSYFLQRQFALLITSYIIFSLWIAAGLDQHFVEARVSSKKKVKTVGYVTMILFPVILYSTFPSLYIMTGVDLIKIRNLPYRDSVQYFFRPDKSQEYGAYNYARETFQYVENHAIIIADFNPGMALQYYQEIMGVREDVEIMIIVDSILFSSKDPVKDLIQVIQKHMDRPVYLADTYEPYYFITQMEEVFKLQKIGHLMKILGTKFLLDCPARFDAPASERSSSTLRVGKKTRSVRPWRSHAERGNESS